MDTVQDLTLPGLIHDLNNVFQTLMEAADLLSEDKKWRGVSAAILRSIDRGRDISRSIETANHPSATFDSVLDKAVTFAQDSVILGDGPQVCFECDVEPGLILRHPFAWERVLINLFLNSVRAMPDGGTIFVEARQREGDMEIVVADEGGGIAPEVLPQVFEPHVSTKTAGGLGLHIVNMIVLREQGQVRAANRPGRGAQFTITVPAEPVLTRSANM